MRTIHRYTLEITDEQRVSTYEGARLLAVHGDTGRQLDLWAEVDLTAPRVERVIYVIGTGGRIPEGRGRLVHVDTVVMQHPRGGACGTCSTAARPPALICARDRRASTVPAGPGDTLAPSAPPRQPRG